MDILHQRSKSISQEWEAHPVELITCAYLSVGEGCAYCVINRPTLEVYVAFLVLQPSPLKNLNPTCVHAVHNSSSVPSVVCEMLYEYRSSCAKAVLLQYSHCKPTAE